MMLYRHFSPRFVSCRRWPGLLGMVLIVAACGQQGAKQSDAPVEVLTGSISDAMLPVDQVTSKPPLDPRVVRTGAPGKSAPVDDATGGTDPVVVQTGTATPAAKPSVGAGASE